MRWNIPSYGRRAIHGPGAAPFNSARRRGKQTRGEWKQGLPPKEPRPAVGISPVKDGSRLAGVAPGPR